MGYQVKKLLFENARDEGIILNLNFFSNDEIEKLKIICNSLVDDYKHHDLTIDNGGLGKDSSHLLSTITCKL